MCARLTSDASGIVAEWEIFRIRSGTCSNVLLEDENVCVCVVVQPINKFILSYFSNEFIAEV